MTMLVYALFGSAEQAMAVARTVVSERLAACANILAPCTSVYEWQGVMEEAAEVPVLFKTGVDVRDALMARIVQLHDYDVPAVIAWPADAVHGPFADWVGDQTAVR